MDLGHFSEDGSEYILPDAQLPRHWYNYLWNDDYVSLFSHLGQGESLAQDDMGRRIALVAGRQLHIRDMASGNCWTANGLPIREGSGYECRHGLGYSLIHTIQEQIRSTFRVFVPREGTCEIWTLTLRNDGESPRTLRVFPYVDSELAGRLKPQAYYMARGEFCEESNAVIFQAHGSFAGSRQVFNFMSSTADITGYDTCHQAFVGFASEQLPDAVQNGCCTNTGSTMEKGILAVQLDVELPPGEKRVLHVILGTACDRDEIKTINERFASTQAIEGEFHSTCEQIQVELGPDRIGTPDGKLNHFAGIWLKRQISLGSRWARVRHNGYRDLTQDIGALAHINPEIALQRFCRVLEFQYSSGYAPRTWLNGEILNKDFADNHVWIPMTLHALVMETGNASLLETEVAFNDGSKASIYEHGMRAVDFLWDDRALHGLCKIRSGDWNDCMESVGPEGRGVSVWLSMAWCVAAQAMLEIAEVLEQGADVAKLEPRLAEMKQNINDAAWADSYYIRAFKDNGDVIGHMDHDRARLFLNTQTWAVLGGIADDDRLKACIGAAEEHLETELGPITVLDAYDQRDDSIGHMTMKAPGVQENGGMYLHAAAFKLVADCMRKRHDKVEELIQKLLPFDQTHYPTIAEPYVFCNCYYATRDYRYGTPGQSWGTGTAAWFYVALLNHVYGLKPELNGLRLDPCLPPSWTTCSIQRSFRCATYHISYKQESPAGRIKEILLDGQPFDSTLLPCESSRAYEVEVTLS